jgi:hypothetical protein
VEQSRRVVVAEEYSVSGFARHGRYFIERTLLRDSHILP